VTRDNIVTTKDTVISCNIQVVDFSLLCERNAFLRIQECLLEDELIQEIQFVVPGNGRPGSSDRQRAQEMIKENVTLGGRVQRLCDVRANPGSFVGQFVPFESADEK